MSSTRKLSNKIKADSPARSNKSSTIETKSTNSTESILPIISTITTPTAPETSTTKILNEKCSEDSNRTIDFYLNKFTTNLTNSEKDNTTSNTETEKINTTNTTTTTPTPTITDTTASSSIQNIDTKNETNTSTTQTIRPVSPVLRTMMDYFILKEKMLKEKKKVMPKRDKLPRKAATSPDSKDNIDHLTRGLVVPGKRKREDSICSDKSDRKTKIPVEQNAAKAKKQQQKDTQVVTTKKYQKKTRQTQRKNLQKKTSADENETNIEEDSIDSILTKDDDASSISGVSVATNKENDSKIETKPEFLINNRGIENDPKFVDIVKEIVGHSDESNDSKSETIASVETTTAKNKKVDKKKSNKLEQDEEEMDEDEDLEEEEEEEEEEKPVKKLLRSGQPVRKVITLKTKAARAKALKAIKELESKSQVKKKIDLKKENVVQRKQSPRKVKETIIKKGKKKNGKYVPKTTEEKTDVDEINQDTTKNVPCSNTENSEINSKPAKENEKQNTENTQEISVDKTNINFGTKLNDVKDLSTVVSSEIFGSNHDKTTEIKIDVEMDKQKSYNSFNMKTKVSPRASPRTNNKLLSILPKTEVRTLRRSINKKLETLTKLVKGEKLKDLTQKSEEAKNAAATSTPAIITTSTDQNKELKEINTITNDKKQTESTNLSSEIKLETDKKDDIEKSDETLNDTLSNQIKKEEKSSELNTNEEEIVKVDSKDNNIEKQEILNNEISKTFEEISHKENVKKDSTKTLVDIGVKEDDKKDTTKLVDIVKEDDKKDTTKLADIVKEDEKKDTTKLLTDIVVKENVKNDSIEKNLTDCHESVKSLILEKKDYSIDKELKKETTLKVETITTENTSLKLKITKSKEPEEESVSLPKIDDTKKEEKSDIVSKDCEKANTIITEIRVKDVEIEKLTDDKNEQVLKENIEIKMEIDEEIIEKELLEENKETAKTQENETPVKETPVIDVKDKISVTDVKNKNDIVKIDEIKINEIIQIESNENKNKPDKDLNVVEQEKTKVPVIENPEEFEQKLEKNATENESEKQKEKSIEIEITETSKNKIKLRSNSECVQNQNENKDDNNHLKEKINETNFEKIQENMLDKKDKQNTSSHPEKENKGKDNEIKSEEIKNVILTITEEIKKTNDEVVPEPLKPDVQIYSIACKKNDKKSTLESKTNESHEKIVETKVEQSIKENAEKNIIANTEPDTEKRVPVLPSSEINSEEISQISNTIADSEIIKIAAETLRKANELISMTEETIAKTAKTSKVKDEKTEIQKDVVKEEKTDINDEKKKEDTTQPERRYSTRKSNMKKKPENSDEEETESNSTKASIPENPCKDEAQLEEINDAVENTKSENVVKVKDETINEETYETVGTEESKQNSDKKTEEIVSDKTGDNISDKTGEIVLSINKKSLKVTNKNDKISSKNNKRRKSSDINNKSIEQIARDSRSKRTKSNESNFDTSSTNTDKTNESIPKLHITISQEGSTATLSTTKVPDTPEADRKENHLKALGLLTLKAAAQAKTEEQKRQNFFRRRKQQFLGNLKQKEKDSGGTASYSIKTVQPSCANTLERKRRSPATATTNKNKDNRQSLKITFQKTSTQNGTNNKNAEEVNYKIQNENENVEISSHKKEEKENILVPEKASSFGIHPERLCQDQCTYCGGKFGLLDTPCHVAQLKSVDRQKNILANEDKLCVDSCLCDACFRHVDKLANVPSYRKRLSAPAVLENNTEETNNGSVDNQHTNKSHCCVPNCTNQANHWLRKKSVRKVLKKLMKNFNMSEFGSILPICSEHYESFAQYLGCALCKRRCGKSHMYHIQEPQKLDKILSQYNIGISIGNSTAICRLCRYFTNLIMKPPVGEQPEREQFINNYRKRLQKLRNLSNVTEVITIDDDSPTKELEQQDNDDNDDDDDDDVTITHIDDNNTSDGSMTSPPKLYAKLRSMLENEVNEKPQQYLGSNNDISITLKSGSSSTPKRILNLPGEDTLSLSAQVPFGNASLSSRTPEGWTRVQTFLQYDEPTRKLWEKLQKPYGNQSSFMRHLLLLEKYFREGDLMLTSKANSNAVVYTNAIQNRLKAYDSMAKDGFIQDSSFETTNKKPRVGENDFPIQLSSSITITPKPKLPVDALKDNSVDSLLKSHLLQGNRSGIEILPISSSKQNTSKQNVSVTATVTSQNDNNVEKLNSSNNNSNTESTNSQSVPLNNNKQPQANNPDSKQKSSNQQQQSSNQQQQSSNQQQEQSPSQRQQSPNQRQQSPNQPQQKSSTQPQQPQKQEIQQNIQQQKQQPQQSLLNQSQQKSLQNKPNVSANNKGSVTKESYRPNIIVLPDTLSPYERANSKNWRPSLMTLTKEAYKNQPDILYQTIDGRRLPGLVQVQSGGKPYLITIHDYNKMCILRREKLLREQIVKTQNGGNNKKNSNTNQQSLLINKQNQQQQQQQQQQHNKNQNQLQQQQQQPNQINDSASTTSRAQLIANEINRRFSEQNNSNLNKIKPVNIATLQQQPSQQQHNQQQQYLTSSSSGPSATVNSLINTNATGNKQSNINLSANNLLNKILPKTQQQLQNQVQILPITSGAGNNISALPIPMNNNAMTTSISILPSLPNVVSMAPINHQPNNFNFSIQNKNFLDSFKSFATGLQHQQQQTFLNQQRNQQQKQQQQQIQAMQQHQQQQLRQSQQQQQHQQPTANNSNSGPFLDSNLLSRIPKSLTVIPQQKFS